MADDLGTSDFLAGDWSPFSSGSPMTDWWSSLIGDQGTPTGPGFSPTFESPGGGDTLVVDNVTGQTMSLSQAWQSALSRSDFQAMGELSSLTGGQAQPFQGRNLSQELQTLEAYKNNPPPGAFNANAEGGGDAAYKALVSRIQDLQGRLGLNEAQLGGNTTAEAPATPLLEQLQAKAEAGDASAVQQLLLMKALGLGGTQSQQGGMNPWLLAALAGAPALLGLAGLGQQLMGGGGKASTTTTKSNAGGPSPAEQAAIEGALRAAGIDPAALGFGGGARGGGPTLSAGGSIVRDASGQPILGSPGTSGTILDRLAGRVPGEEAAFNTGLANLVGTQGQGYDALSRLLGPLTSGLPQVLGGQENVLGLLPQAAGRLAQPSVATPFLEQQATGMAQGRLPSLADPELIRRIGEIFAGRQQDISRYLDTAITDALERSRQQGFAGGNEVFREGTPQALLAPALAEAVRQQGTLQGQRAQTEVNLASALPQQGATLDQLLANIANTRLGGVGTAAGAYTQPAAMRVGGANQLLGQNITGANTLYNASIPGIVNSTDIIRALSNLGESAARTRLAGAGTTSTTNASTNLLDLFGPTGQLFGGIGGALGALAKV